jgi:quinol monooxygenase YgiN
MIVEYVRYELTERERGRFGYQYRKAGQLLNGDSNCLGWELRRGVEEPGHHVVRITWNSQDGHENGFRSTPAYQQFLELLRPFRPFIQEMGHFELVTDDKGNE